MTTTTIAQRRRGSSLGRPRQRTSRRSPPALTAPVLALMGGADDGIPASEITAFETALGRAAVDHDLVVYPDAPHGFFDASNEGFADACADAWRRTLEFIERHG